MRRVKISFEFDIDERSFPETYEEYAEMSDSDLTDAIEGEIAEKGSAASWLSDFFDPDHEIEVSGEK